MFISFRVSSFLTHIPSNSLARSSTASQESYDSLVVNIRFWHQKICGRPWRHFLTSPSFCFAGCLRANAACIHIRRCASEFRKGASGPCDAGSGGGTSRSTILSIASRIHHTPRAVEDRPLIAGIGGRAPAAITPAWARTKTRWLARAPRALVLFFLWHLCCIAYTGTTWLPMESASASRPTLMDFHGRERGK